MFVKTHLHPTHASGVIPRKRTEEDREEIVTRKICYSVSQPEGNVIYSKGSNYQPFERVREN